MSHSPTYSPYGAHELKRCYQRNLAIACVVAMVLFTGGALVMLTLLDGAPAVTIIEDVSDHTGRFFPLAGITSNTEINVRPTGPPPVDREGAVPVGVDDDLIPGDADQPLIGDDWSPFPGAVGDSEDWTPGGEREGSLGGLPLSTPNYPAPDSFIPVEIQPKLIDYVKPDYPRMAKSAGLEGLVWIQALVDVDGKVVDAIIALSSGVELLDEAALAASYKCTFSPGVQNGTPVAVWVAYRVAFKLNNGRH